jgi:hypothetical protein
MLGRRKEKHLSLQIKGSLITGHRAGAVLVIV